MIYDVVRNLRQRQRLARCTAQVCASKERRGIQKDSESSDSEGAATRQCGEVLRMGNAFGYDEIMRQRHFSECE